MQDSTVPNYGRQVELNSPWKGYHRGVIVGKSGYRYEIQLSSGAVIELYEDEFEYD